MTIPPRRSNFAPRRNPALEYWGPYTPPRCKATQLPAYESVEKIETIAKNIPISITHKWQCASCNMWHKLSCCRGPSGETSGSDKRKIECVENNAEKFNEFKKRGLVLEPEETKKSDSKLGQFDHL